jgi:hypothetical protein
MVVMVRVWVPGGVRGVVLGCLGLAQVVHVAHGANEAGDGAIGGLFPESELLEVGEGETGGGDGERRFVFT